MHPLIKTINAPVDDFDFGMSDTSFFHIGKEDLPEIKRAMAAAFPAVAPTTRMEIFARAAGWQTAASMQAALKAEPSAFFNYVDQSEEGKPLHDLVYRELVSGRMDGIQARLALLCRVHVEAWLTSKWCGAAQPENIPDMLERAQSWSSGEAGAVLAKYVMETKKLGWFMGLPGQVGTRFSEGDFSSEDEALDIIYGSVHLAAAIDATLPACHLDAIEIETLGEGVYVDGEGGEHEASELTSAIADAFLSVLKKIDAPTGSRWRLGENAIDEPVSLGAVFRTSRRHGPPVTPRQFRAASVILATCLLGMPPEAAANRLEFEIDELQDLFGRHGLPAPVLMEERVMGAAALLAESPSRTAAIYGPLVIEVWTEKPLLDEWMGLLDKIAKPEEDYEGLIL